ncbi:MAG: hypothetical protein SPL47_03380 [Bacteroidales bacterium]|nr:hypothetical protein [Bacteroidales bacterium]
MAGIDLSDRVWKCTRQYREQIEMAVDIGLREHKSAAQLSRDVRYYLKEPNRLFRKVRGAAPLEGRAVVPSGAGRVQVVVHERPPPGFHGDKHGLPHLEPHAPAAARLRGKHRGTPERQPHLQGQPGQAAAVP